MTAPARGYVGGAEEWDQTACKPGSVPPPEGDAAIIPLDQPSRASSRDLPGFLEPTTALPDYSGAGSLFGLAPGGACHAVPVTRHAVRSYRTLSPFPSCEGGLLSVALSLGSPPAGVYPPPCRRGARTFLEPCGPRPPSRLIHPTDGRLPAVGQPVSRKASTTPSAGRGSRHRRSRPPYPAASAAGKRGPPRRCPHRTGPMAAARSPSA